MLLLECLHKTPPHTGASRQQGLQQDRRPENQRLLKRLCPAKHSLLLIQHAAVLATKLP
jgi:hypothetical protein